jgi:drug/metabolite transporter (DMT)-like permease
MRAAPPIEVALHRFGLWRAAILALAAASAGVVIAWVASRDDQQDAAVTLAAALLGALCIAMAAASARTEASLLRWDGMRWQLTRAARGAETALWGAVGISIDLGFWMLLRFVAESPAGGRRVTWLPVQRRGLETQWHGLRCAVYSPRPQPRTP